jgi:GTP cyclohydrolase II
MLSSGTGLNQRAGSLRVDRAIFELRRGRPVEVQDAHGVSVFASVERLDSNDLKDYADPDGEVRLVITSERARTLGLSETDQPLVVARRDDISLGGLLELATGRAEAVGLASEDLDLAEADPRGVAALALARCARLIPALVQRRPEGATDGLSRLSVSASDIEAYPHARSQELRRISRARVPLAAAEDCELVVYRERFGDAEHLAILIGAPEPVEPVTVRLHSACLTGDLLASLRCDCGDQLRGAVERIAESGGGLLLYLAQEGRGIGLANKLRAYALQEQGLNTLQADQHLGFRADERDYAMACAMLKDLGFNRIRLLTNNPDKIAALSACDVEVVGRLPLSAPVNKHNASYLRAKREHAGHLDTDAEDV